MTDDLRFSELLREDAAALPPPKTVNPWQTALGHVLWGLALTTVTLRFLYLDTLLPALGGILLVLGFRTLRRENRPLRWCYRLSLLSLALRTALFVLAALPVDTGYAPAYVSAAVLLAIYVCLWRGMVGISRSAGAEKPSAPAAGAMAVFYALLLPLAHIGLEGWLAVLPLLIVYILLLRSMRRLVRSLTDTGYAVAAAPVRLSGAAVLWTYFAALLAAILLALFLGQRCPMSWQSRDDAPQDAALRQRLLALDFPEDVLDDLTADEVLRLSDTAEVYAETSCRDGVVITHVAAITADTPRRAVFVQHINAGGALYGYANAVETVPVWCAAPQVWSRGTYLSGRVLLECGGETVAAPFCRLEQYTVTDRSFFGVSTRDIITADWSWQRGGKSGRAYLLYDACLTTDDAVSIDSWCNYLPQTRPVYPCRDPLAMWNGLSLDAVQPVQSQLHLYYEGSRESDAP